MTALSGTVLGGAVIGASAGLTNGLISGYGFARLGGSSIGQSLLSGLKSGAIGLASGAIIGGATQGISNVYHGKNFWTGEPSASAASVANSTSSTASQPADMTLDEFASQHDKSPATPVGHKDFEIKVVEGTNKSTYINGREYSGHALDRMQGRGLYPSVVEDAIDNGTMSLGKTQGTYIFNTRTISVVINENGKVITVWQK